MPKVFFLNEDKDALFLLLFLNPKSSIPEFVQNGREKSTEVVGGGGGILLVFNVYTFDPIIS